MQIELYTDQENGIERMRRGGGRGKGCGRRPVLEMKIARQTDKLCLKRWIRKITSQSREFKGRARERRHRDGDGEDWGWERERGVSGGSWKEKYLMKNVWRIVKSDQFDLHRKVIEPQKLWSLNGGTRPRNKWKRDRKRAGGRRNKGPWGREEGKAEKAAREIERTENLSNHAQLLKYINVIIISTGQHAESLTACSKRQLATATTTRAATATWATTTATRAKREHWKINKQ